MRFLLFPALYFCTGMAVAQSAGYTTEGWVLAAAVVVLQATFLGALFGVFGGRVS